MRHDAIGEVPAGIQDRQAGLHGWSVHDDVADIQQGPNRGSDILFRQLGPLSQNPHKLAQAGQGYGDQRGFTEQLAGRAALIRIILKDGARQNVGIDRNLHD